MKAACLAAYEDQVWTDVHNYQKYTFDDQETVHFADQLVDQAMLERPVMRAQLRKLYIYIQHLFHRKICTKDSTRVINYMIF